MNAFAIFFVGFALFCGAPLLSYIKMNDYKQQVSSTINLNKTLSSIGSSRSFDVGMPPDLFLPIFMGTAGFGIMLLGCALIARGGSRNPAPRRSLINDHFSEGGAFYIDPETEKQILRARR